MGENDDGGHACKPAGRGPSPCAQGEGLEDHLADRGEAGAHGH
jgi:hypothetical protein